MIQMTYQKKNGQIIKRTITGFSPYRVGDINSYGWEVIDIKHFYKGKWYSKRDFEIMISKNQDNFRKKIKMRNFISNLYKNVGYFLELMIMLKIFDVVSNKIL